jgi:mRNA interferase MazF
MTSKSIPERGDIWLVDLNPTRGAEIGKRRTAVVVSCDGLGRLPLHIIVPITAWQPDFAAYPWFEKISPTPKNGLSKESGADAFQMRSVSRDRFVKKLGIIPRTQLQDICLRISLCIGLDPATGGAQ